MEEEIIQQYFKEISKFLPLTRKEEKETAKRAKEGDFKAREKLINAHLMFVVSVAKKYINKGTSLSDLIQYGNLGLLKCVDNFNPEKARFTSYSLPWIEDNIQKGMKKENKMIKIPEDVYLKIERFLKMEEMGYSQKDLSKIMGISLETMKYLININQDHFSFNMNFPGENFSFQEIIPDKKYLLETHFIQMEGIEKKLNENMNLNPRELRIIKQRFGFNSDGEYTLDEVGIQEGITRERVRQIEKKAITKLFEDQSFQKLQAYL